MKLRKPVMMGLDFVRGDRWEPILASSESGARRVGDRRMPRDLRRAGFVAFVSDAGDYYRVSYGKRIPW